MAQRRLRAAHRLRQPRQPAAGAATGRGREIAIRQAIGAGRGAPRAPAARREPRARAASAAPCGDAGRHAVSDALVAWLPAGIPRIARGVGRRARAALHLRRRGDHRPVLRPRARAAARAPSARDRCCATTRGRRRDARRCARSRRRRAGDRARAARRRRTADPQLRADAARRSRLRDRSRAHVPGADGGSGVREGAGAHRVRRTASSNG